MRLMQESLEQKDGKFHVVVRKARAGEKLSALDQKEYALSESMLVIADGNKDESIGIAGIKGGTPAGITEATTDIILEAANFNGVFTRKAAQMLKLRTDASARFEQGYRPSCAPTLCKARSSLS
jgi:phenylalanyl-tRNA synthetase beta chain